VYVDWTKKYDDKVNPVVYDWVRQLMAMTVLPTFAVPLVWDWWLRFPPATGSVTVDAKL